MDNISKEDLILEFLDKRPQIIGAFGYGSGVTNQSGYNSNYKPQIDLIVVVGNDKKWHLENIKSNPSDYSFFGRTFYKFAPESWYHYGTDICYIINVPYNGHMFKIGVVNKKDLINDLLYWKNFYLAGRFQKPMLRLKSDSEIDNAIDINRKNALIASLFLLDSDQTTVKQLYKKLCSLSYVGDTRMRIAENPNKINNIVEGSFDVLNNFYLKYELFEQNNGYDKIDYDMGQIIKEIYNIPIGVPTRKNSYGKKELTQLKRYIVKYLAKKNKKASIKQTLKGFITTGPSKALGYAYKKIVKRFFINH